jgi:alkyl sulfatase BDS1-like metallo-beta-lactamase superfamily hydrolase
MSHGWRPAEIAEMLKLPPGLDARWHARGYHGAVSHNVKSATSAGTTATRRT